MATKRAPVGLQEPVEGSLHGVSHAYTSELDRSAIRTACFEQPSLARIMTLTVSFRRTLRGRAGMFSD